MTQVQPVPGAEDACSALWTELRLKDTGVEKQEFLVAGAEKWEPILSEADLKKHDQISHESATCLQVG